MSVVVAKPSFNAATSALGEHSDPSREGGDFSFLCRPDVVRRVVSGFWGDVVGVAVTEDGTTIVGRRPPRTVKTLLRSGVDLASEEPFRTEPQTKAETQLRNDRLNSVNASEKQLPISNKTTLFQARVSVPGLKPGHEGLTILHLTDIHFVRDRVKPLQRVLALARYCEQQKVSPDILALTGDILSDVPADFHAKAVRALERICPQGIKVWTAGNHDFYGSGIDYVRGALASIGFIDLSYGQPEVQGHARFRINGSPLNIWGMDDFLEGRPQISQMAADYAHETNILLLHNLDGLRRSCPDVFDLVLSGHTHGGEIWGGTAIMKYFRYLQAVNRQVLGWDMLTNRALSYVGPGLTGGHWGRWLGGPTPGAMLMTLTGQS